MSPFVLYQIVHFAIKRISQFFEGQCLRLPACFPSGDIDLCATDEVGKLLLRETCCLSGCFQFFSHGGTSADLISGEFEVIIVSIHGVTSCCVISIYPVGYFVKV